MDNTEISLRDFLKNYPFELKCAIYRKIVGRDTYTREYYNGKKILTFEEGNRLIRKKFDEGAPFCAVRFGDGELRATMFAVERMLGLRKHYPDYIREALCKNAGFFPNEEKSIDRFGQLIVSSCNNIDILAVWFNLFEDYIFKRSNYVDAEYIPLKALESFWADDPWTEKLSGKNVVVIHPFADTIKQQYSKRESLFANTKILPEFNLITFKAVQSIGGRSDKFQSWFEALEWMYNEVIKIDFDVALIGCGAYGFPLASKIKEYGKIAIHMGGVTQFLFGIKGNRWDKRPDYVKFYNEHWCRPSENEKPEFASEVENGCYW